MQKVLKKLPINFSGTNTLQISARKSSYLKKAVIEEFLPRFGKGCEVLCVKDTSSKVLYIEEQKLNDLKFFKLSNEELPDIIAYNNKKNWVYLIEAVYSSGPMSETRVLELKKLLKDCKAYLIFITTFISRTELKKWALDIAWETEVWTADHPDHVIHYNGDKFFGPYK
ncbi:MAG: BsuBI/PstI family type II restriction endonuclease [Panacibacter sp.]